MKSFSAYQVENSSVHESALAIRRFSSRAQLPCFSYVLRIHLNSHFLCLFKSVSLPFDLVYVCECNFGDGCNYALSSSTSLPVQLQR